VAANDDVADLQLAHRELDGGGLRLVGDREPVGGGGDDVARVAHDEQIPGSSRRTR